MTTCPLCHTDADELKKQAAFWRAAFDGQKNLSRLLHDRLLVAQRHSEALDHQPTGRFDTDPTPHQPLPRRWRRT